MNICWNKNIEYILNTQAVWVFITGTDFSKFQVDIENIKQF